MSDIQKAIDWDRSKIFIIDTETTGLGENDEVLSLSVVNVDGDVLFDELIKPAHRQRWSEAQKIHGIAPKDVKNKKLLVDYEDELKKYFGKGCLLVGYNIDFDFNMLYQSGARFQCELFDVMDTYSQVHGKWSDWKQERLWSKLGQCAKHYGYRNFEAHGSLEDAKATAYCFNCLLEDEKVITHWRNIFHYRPNENYQQRLERIQKQQEQENALREKQRQQQQQKANEDTSGCGTVLGIMIAVPIIIAMFMVLF